MIVCIIIGSEAALKISLYWFWKLSLSKKPVNPSWCTLPGDKQLLALFLSQLRMEDSYQFGE